MARPKKSTEEKVELSVSTPVEEAPKVKGSNEQRFIESGVKVREYSFISGGKKYTLRG